MLSVETIDLTYRFSRSEVVPDRVNLRVEPGSIYGFLGPNGAGKTTTLRLILGLLRPASGSVSLFGKDVEKKRIEVLRDIGSMIESPSLYGHLTAEENLQVWRNIYQCPRQRIKEVLELVGLAQTGTKRVSQFSLGMKQRLGIAVALLHNPSLLILDEPTNGLDPNGMIDIRELLISLNKKLNITIVISSHLLAEIEKLVSHVGIINKGRMLFQGTLEELKKKQHESAYVIIDTSDPKRTAVVLANHNISSQFKESDLVIPAFDKQRIAQINRLLVNEGIDVFSIRNVTNDLESIFMDIIQRPV